MNKICGHDREVLKWALAFTDGPDVSKARKWAPGEYEVCQAVEDPAKLAKMLAERGRQLGLSAEYVDYEKRFESLAGVAFYANENFVFVEDGDKEHAFTIPTARALTLKWLDCKTVEEAIAAMGISE